MIVPLKSVELSSLGFCACLTHLGEALQELRDMTVTADFGDNQQVEQYKANIAFIKRYYEALERITYERQR